MPTFSPHFKVGISETVSERADLINKLQNLSTLIQTFETSHGANPGLTAVRNEIGSIITTINGFNLTTYTVNAVTDVITRVNALRKTLKTARATMLESARVDFTNTVIKSTELDQAIDSADKFSSKAIGGIMNHTKNGVFSALAWTGDKAKKSVKPVAITLGVAAGLTAGGFAAKKGYDAVFTPPGAQPSPELVNNDKFNFRNIFETYLVHNGGEKNIDATSFDNLWGAMRDETASRARQTGKMADGITLEGTETGDTLVIYADKEGGRKVMTLSARDKTEGREAVDMWYREDGQIMHKTGKTGSQYAPTTREAMLKIFKNRADFIGQ